MAEWRRWGLYQPSMKSKTAMRASTWVLKRRRSSSSHSSVAKKLSHIALSKQSPTEPIEGRTPASSQRLPKGDRSVLGEFKRSSQDLDRENCDDYSKAPFRSMRASTVAITGPASGSTAGELSAVLGIDCGRPFNR